MGRLCGLVLFLAYVGPVDAGSPLPPLHFLLEAFGSNSIRVRVAVPGQGSVVEPAISALLVQAPPSFDDAGNTMNATQTDPHALTNGNLKIILDPATYQLTATRVSDGKVLLKQTGLKFNEACVGSKPGSKAITATFASTKDERIYGLGEHVTGKVMQLPYEKVFSDSLFYGKSRGADVSIPFFSSSLGYGFLWNLPSFGSVSMKPPSDMQWVSDASLGLDIWITTTAASTTASTTAPTADAAAAAAVTSDAPAAAVGKDVTPKTRKRSIYADILHQYADAVGHAIPMPTWSTGFIQCKDRYRNQTQLLDVAKGYKKRNLPISMIVIDWFHWEQVRGLFILR
jgi:alpha-D-xyloside xylohydrolase